jgi:hypothetical protein
VLPSHDSLFTKCDHDNMNNWASKVFGWLVQRCVCDGIDTVKISDIKKKFMILHENHIPQICKILVTNKILVTEDPTKRQLLYRIDRGHIEELLQSQCDRLYETTKKRKPEEENKREQGKEESVKSETVFSSHPSFDTIFKLELQPNKKSSSIKQNHKRPSKASEKPMKVCPDQIVFSTDCDNKENRKNVQKTSSQ